MRVLLYVLACALLVTGGLMMGMLARLVPAGWLFMIAGALISGLISGAWLLVRATAEGLPRPRTGQVLIFGGAAGALYSFYDADWVAGAWGIAVLVVGFGFLYKLLPMARTARVREQNPNSVRPPLKRRAHL